MSRGRSALLLLALLIGGMLTGLLSLLGISLPFAIAWGILIVAGFALAPGVDVEPDQKWPPPVPARSSRGSEVARLAWSFNMRGDTAGLAVQRRVHALLRRRMQRYDIDLDDPADLARAGRLLGQGILDAALAAEPRREDIEGLLDAMDRLPQELPEEKRKP